MRRVGACLLVAAIAGCTTTTTTGGPGGVDGVDGASGGSAGSTGSASPGSIATVMDHVGLTMSGDFTQVVPVLLLKEGVACDCLDEDISTVTLDDIRQRKPKVVGQWRATGDGVEVNWGKSWSKLYFKATGLPLGDDWTTTGSYNSTATIGDSASGTFAGASRTINFDASGHFAFAGGAVTNTSASTTKSHGSYVVSGWMLTLTYDDGTESHVTAVTSSDKPGATLWLSGAAYSKP